MLIYVLSYKRHVIVKQCGKLPTKCYSGHCELSEVVQNVVKHTCKSDQLVHLP